MKTEQAEGKHFEPCAIEVTGALSEVAGKLVTRLIHRVRDRRNRNAALYPAVLLRRINRRIASAQSRLHADLIIHESNCGLS